MTKKIKQTDNAFIQYKSLLDLKIAYNSIYRNTGKNVELSYLEINELLLSISHVIKYSSQVDSVHDLDVLLDDHNGVQKGFLNSDLFDCFSINISKNHRIVVHELSYHNKALLVINTIDHYTNDFQRPLSFIKSQYIDSIADNSKLSTETIKDDVINSIISNTNYINFQQSKFKNKFLDKSRKVYFQIHLTKKCDEISSKLNAKGLSVHDKNQIVKEIFESKDNKSESDNKNFTNVQDVESIIKNLLSYSSCLSKNQFEYNEQIVSTQLGYVANLFIELSRLNFIITKSLNKKRYLKTYKEYFTSTINNAVGQADEVISNVECENEKQKKIINFCKIAIQAFKELALEEVLDNDNDNKKQRDKNISVVLSKGNIVHCITEDLDEQKINNHSSELFELITKSNLLSSNIEQEDLEPSKFNKFVNKHKFLNFLSKDLSKYQEIENFKTFIKAGILDRVRLSTLLDCKNLVLFKLEGKKTTIKQDEIKKYKDLRIKYIDKLGCWSLKWNKDPYNASFHTTNKLLLEFISNNKLSFHKPIINKKNQVEVIEATTEIKSKIEQECSKYVKNSYLIHLHNSVYHTNCATYEEVLKDQKGRYQETNKDGINSNCRIQENSTLKIKNILSQSQKRTILDDTDNSNSNKPPLDPPPITPPRRGRRR